MRELGIDRLSVFGMPPPQFARLAAELRCRWIGIGLAPTGGYNPHGFPDWSLRDDAVLRRETIAVLRGEGVRISLVEGFAISPERNVRDYAHDLDLVAKMGGDRLNVVSLDKDLERTIAGMATLSAMAAEHGVMVSAELGSLGPIPTLTAALALAQGVGMPNFSLLLDAMHFFRLGNTVDDLATVDPCLIGYAQLCDAPWHDRFDTYLEEAMYERLVPGTGELPLQSFVRALPQDIIVSLEMPLRSLADQGVDARERLAPCVTAARALLEGCEPR